MNLTVLFCCRIRINIPTETDCLWTPVRLALAVARSPRKTKDKVSVRSKCLDGDR